MNEIKIFLKKDSNKEESCIVHEELVSYIVIFLYCLVIYLFIFILQQYIYIYIYFLREMLSVVLVLYGLKTTLVKILAATYPSYNTIILIQFIGCLLVYREK
jgi:hypothetical protein